MKTPMRNHLVAGIWRLCCLLSLLMVVGCGSGTPRGASCLYGGRSHGVGDSFTSTDGCNSCSCTTSGVACTERACLNDGAVPDTNHLADAGADATSAAGTAGTDGNNVSDATTSDGRTDADAAAGACTYGGRTYGAGDTFPSSDGCNTCTCTTGAQVACTLRACIDGPPSTTACSFDRTYSFWDDGGFRAYADRSTLGPERTHLVARDQFINSLPVTCSRQMACSDAAAVDVNDIQLALTHADVVAALSLATKPFYGTDARPVDGSVFVFERDDQRGFMLGSGSVPAGLQALADLLHALQSETIGSPSCSNL